MSRRPRHPSDGAGSTDEAELVIDIAPELGSSAATEPSAPAPAPVEYRALTPTPVSAEDVSYVRVGRTILDSVTLSVSPGESVAVVGPSGSGKSSLLALLAGLEPPDSGAVRRGARADDGLILQGYGLVGVLTAAENVEAPLQAGARGRLGRAQVRDRAAGFLDTLGLTTVADHLVEELSGGQQQRVAIARALVVDPAVVFADELTAELDQELRGHVVELVLDVAARGGIVVLATHDLELAAACDRMVHLVDGRLVPDPTVVAGRGRHRA